MESEYTILVCPPPTMPIPPKNIKQRTISDEAQTILAIEKRQPRIEFGDKIWILPRRDKLGPEVTYGT